MLRSLRKSNLLWNTDLRYEVGMGDRKPEDVATLMMFAKKFWDWIKERL